MKVVIIDCLAVGEERRTYSRDFIGGGPKLIAGVLNLIGIKDLNIKIIRAEDLILEKERFINDYQMCLISAMSMDFKPAKIIVNLWRSINGKKLIIIGGPIASDSNILKKLDGDISVEGESEKKITEIIEILINNNLEINSENSKKICMVKGITFRYSGEITETKPSDYLDLEEYNFYSNPKYFLEFIKHYDNFQAARIYIEVLRGCSNFLRTKFRLSENRVCLETCNLCRDEFVEDKRICPANIPPGCGFCSTINSFGPPKSRKTEFIISEIEGLISRGARRIVLGAPDFLDYKREELVESKVLTNASIPPEPNYEALNELVEKIISINEIKEGRAQVFIENVKASLCTTNALQIIAKIPNPIFSIGCETGSKEFSEKLGRPFNPLETLDAIKSSLSMGIRIHVYFIHSLPGETVESLKASISLINEFYRLGVDKITIYKYQDIPGAPFNNLLNKAELLRKKDKKINQLRKKLVRLAVNFNRMRKEEMIGKEFSVILAEPSHSKKADIIGYILQGGPKVLVKDRIDLLGQVITVKIINVLSDKLVEGQIILSNKNSDKE